MDQLQCHFENPISFPKSTNQTQRLTSAFRAWFISWRRESWCNEAETSIFEGYLERLLMPDEAAQNITAPTQDRHLPIGSNVGRVWQLLFSCATNCPESHAAIIDLIKEITSIPKPTEGKQVDWTDQRTSFGELWRDNYDSLQSNTLSKHVAPHGSPSVSISQKWINFNAFSAAFEATNVFPSSVAGYGIYIIIDALEKKSVKGPQLEVRIPAAGQWFIHGSRIMLVNGKNMGSTLWGQIESELWKGKPGFSKERWTFWKERMERMSVREQSSDETREIARSSVVAMGKAERALARK